jgi:glutamate-1-semialdehyde aminotransferase
MYNKPNELDAIVAEHGKDIAAIVMEPVRYSDPDAGFLEHCRAVADKIGAVLVFDEVTAAFRQNIGGAHMRTPVRPDVAVFAKALANGYAMAAIIGKRGVMEAAQRSFISSTNWTERIGPTAALATIKKMRAKNVPAHLVEMGNAMRAVWSELAEKHGVHIHVKGVPPMSTFALDHGELNVALSTLYSQEMLDRGFLASKAFYVTYAHQTAHLAAYKQAADGAFASLRRAIDAGKVELRGPVQHTGFFRLA